MKYLILALFAVASSGSVAQDHESGVAEISEKLASIAYIDTEDNGDLQSPINIISSQAVPGHHQVVVHYQPSGQRIANLGHTVEVFYDEGSSLEFDGQNYQLQQIHFHTPSEHLIDGITYPMEMHMVHTLEGNNARHIQNLHARQVESN